MNDETAAAVDVAADAADAAAAVGIGTGTNTGWWNDLESAKSNRARRLRTAAESNAAAETGAAAARRRSLVPEMPGDGIDEPAAAAAGRVDSDLFVAPLLADRGWDGGFIQLDRTILQGGAFAWASERKCQSTRYRGVYGR